MSQISPYFRKVRSGYGHWCPACGEMHVIYTEGNVKWDFNGDVNNPTFSPSVKITGKQKILVNGKWTGVWKRDKNGNALDGCCHYFIQNGKIKYCGDCTHEFSGKEIPLPKLPPWLMDEDEDNENG